jgi:adenylylsulfate kinase-like enzyme
MTKKIKGIWFFGLSGSGKTHCSKYLKKKIRRSMLVDGDIVRRYISRDIGYNLKDRLIQINRVFGIAKIAIMSDIFPIISTVYFDNRLNKFCKKEKILPIKIFRSNMDVIKSKRHVYRNSRNVVGKDILLPSIKCKTIYNSGDKNFCKKLDSLIL